MKNKNFLNISDFSAKEILNILNLNPADKILKNKTLGMIFEKQSTRTRLSFSTAIFQMGGNPIDIRFQELNISREESFEDTFKAFNCYLDGLIYRTNNHQKLIDSSLFFKKPIINALSDISHPCQALADLLTIKEYFGTLKINILWMGDMNNVCFSLVEVANLIKDISLVICSPSSISSKKTWHLNSNIIITNSLDKIDLANINCVMTDVFLSMNDDHTEKKISILRPYVVNSDIMSKTNKDSIFMHCLPAKVGFEVSEEVFRGPKSIVWKQAYNRMVAQKKLLQFIYQ